MIARYAGQWMLARSITDADIANDIACIGTATLQPALGVLAYTEAVSYRIGARIVRGTRAYTFALEDGAVVARFSDGAPFFELRLDPMGRGSAVHHCGLDRYRLELDAGQPDRWTTRWFVTGTKRLRIETCYTRAAPG